MALESIEDVRLFRQIVASGSISAAARVLGDNKNRISQRLAALERALGVRLAARSTRHLKLTEEGERFLAASDELMASAERVEAAVSRPEALDGRVRIAIRSTTAGIGLGEEIARLLLSARQLSLQVTVLDDDADLLALRAHGLDLAIQVGKLKDSSFIAKKLGDVRFAICATPAYLAAYGRPKKPADLEKHECIRRLGSVPETSWSLLGRNGQRVKAKVKGRLECSDARFQAEALYGGFGIGLRPAAEVRRGIESGVLERVLPTYSLEPIAVWLVSPHGRQSLPRVNRVAELIARSIARLTD